MLGIVAKGKGFDTDTAHAVVDEYDEHCYPCLGKRCMMANLMNVETMLDTIDRLVAENRTGEIPAVVARARAELLDDDTLVTTTQAAKLLGIGSINTVKAMVRGGEIAEARKVGNRTMIPLREIKRLQETPLMHDLRAIAAALSVGAPAGEDEETPMSQEQMDILEAGRPGAPPWQR